MKAVVTLPVRPIRRKSAKSTDLTIPVRPIRGKSAKSTAFKVIACSVEILHRDMTEYAKELSEDPKAARGFLLRAGIITRAGKVAKAYGGHRAGIITRAGKVTKAYGG